MALERDKCHVETFQETSLQRGCKGTIKKINNGTAANKNQKN